MKSATVLSALVAFVSLPAAPAALADCRSEAVTQYSTATTDIGTLLDNPETKAILYKHLSTTIKNPQIAMARGLTLRAIQAHASYVLTDEALDKIDADLAGLVK